MRSGASQSPEMQEHATIQTNLGTGLLVSDTSNRSATVQGTANQERYVNPYTNEVEQDSADYRFRWTTPTGDRLYSNQDGVDPNRDEHPRQFEWKRTP
jgi:hypothetical protein